MSSEETKTQMTAKEYDLKQVSDGIQKLLFSGSWLTLPSLLGGVGEIGGGKVGWVGGLGGRGDSVAISFAVRGFCPPSHNARVCTVPAAFTAFLHFQMQIVFPLAIQSVLGPINMYGSPLVKVYFLGQSATGKLKRPWEAKAMDPISQYKAMMNHLKNDGQPPKKSAKERKSANKLRRRK